MAATPYQVTFFFEGVQRATIGASAAVGWSESWFANIEAPIDAVLTNTFVDSYISLRRACLADAYRISFVRVSSLANSAAPLSPRLYKIRTPASAFGAIKNPTDCPMSAQVQCALLIDLCKLPKDTLTRTVHRKFLMRGLPAEVISGNVINSGAGSWNNIKTFLDYMASHETGTPAPTLPPQTLLGARYYSPLSVPTQIDTISVNGPDARLVNLAPALAAPLRGQLYHVWRVPNRGFNRTWTILAVAGTPPTAVQMGRLKKPSTEKDYVGPGAGMVRLIDYAYGLYDQYTVIGLRSKRTGRIFRQVRGRGSVRV